MFSQNILLLLKMDDEHIKSLLDGIKETLDVISEKHELYDQHIQPDQKNKQIEKKRKKDAHWKNNALCVKNT